jgi:hypothetical protein
LVGVGGDFLRWSSDGTAMTWALGTQLFRQTINAAEPQKTKGEPGGVREVR